MFEYVDLYMADKPDGLKYVVLNVYGGEALHHPDIVEILQAVREKHKQYQDRWHLTITTTTNAIINQRKLNSIIALIDEFTVSYHVENTDKNKQLFRDNILAIKAAGRRQKCIVLIHPEKELFDDCQAMISWLSSNNVKYLPRQLDHGARRNKDVPSQDKFTYKNEQVIWFNKFYKSKGALSQTINPNDENTDLSAIGRACCGGRQLCSNQNYKEKQFFVHNRFPDWYCSVNHFFLYVKQVNGEIFVNKDCMMNFDGTIGPIGHLSDTQKLIDKTSTWIKTNTMPVIQCKKNRCDCGLCAPKAETSEEYNKIFRKYIRK